MRKITLVHDALFVVVVLHTHRARQTHTEAEQNARKTFVSKENVSARQSRAIEYWHCAHPLARTTATSEQADGQSN